MKTEPLDDYEAIERLVNSLRRQGLFMEGTGGGVDFPAKNFHAESYTIQARVEGDDFGPTALFDRGSIVFSVILDDDEQMFFDGECRLRFASVRSAIKALSKMKAAKADKIVKPFVKRDSRDYIVTSYRQVAENVKDKQGRVVKTTITKSYEDKTFLALSESHAEYLAMLEDACLVESVREAPKPRRKRS